MELVRFRSVQRRLRVWWIGAAISLVMCDTARAQVVTVATPVDTIFATGRTHDELKALTKLYNAGDWEKLQKTAGDMVNGIAKAGGVPDNAKAALDTTRNHVALIWLGADANDAPQVMRTVLHDSPREIFSVDLPGVHDSATDGALYELLLTRTNVGRSVSAYTSTREADPLTEALPGFIQAIAGPLFGTFAAAAGGELAAPKVLYATVKRVGLPFKRASVKVTTLVKDPWFERADYVDGIAKLAAKVRFEDVSASSCGRDLVDRLSIITPPPACTNPNVSACKAAFDSLMATAFKDAFVACDDGTPSDTNREALQIADKRFRDYVTSSVTATATLELTFKNRPLTRVAFGAGSGVMMRPRLTEPRVNITDGVITADPLTRVMTMAFVNVSPGGYNADSAKMSAHERVRLMFGASLTPDFGVVAGVNILMSRGIGISIGWAALFGTGAAADAIGAPPADAKDPFKLTVANTPFVGITYNYK